MSSSNPTDAPELARRLANSWALYAYEFLASVDARCEVVTLSDLCERFAAIRELLRFAVADGTYHQVPQHARQEVLDIAGHVRDVHPQYWHLFHEDPGPAANALLDQVDAARSEAEAAFGTSK